MPQERAEFRSDIEGIRGVAILLVVAFHAGVPWMSGGFVGVDVFFVLSGFLITGLLARELASTGDVDLGEFYARRARRLLPAFLVVVIATIALALWIYAPIDQQPIAAHARNVALHYGNVAFAREAVDYHASSGNPFLHTWSLAVEEQFYIIWPLLFVLLGRAGPGDGTRPSSELTKRFALGIAATGGVSFLASLWLTGAAQPWAFFGMPTRIWEFALGGLVALDAGRLSKISTKSGTLLQAAGVAAIAVAALFYDQATPYPGLAALAPVLGTAALLVGGMAIPAGAVTRALSMAVLRWFGRVSYSWYLWHWPLVGVGAVIDWRIGVAGRLAWSGVALLLAVLTLRFVEEPARRSSWLRDRSYSLNLVALGASLSAVLIAYGAMLVAQRRVSSPAQRVYALAREDGMEHDCWGSLLENSTAPCVFGDRSSTETVVLMGDSHAEHWLPAVDRIGKESGWKVIAMVKPACPVADIPELVNGRLKRRYTECTAWRRAMLRRIVALRPMAVILSSYDHYMPAKGKRSESRVTPTSWRDGLRRTYSQLSAAGINTIVMRDVPQPGFDVPACLSRRAARAPFRLRDCSYDRDESLSQRAILAQNEAARGLDRVAFVDMTDRLCSRSPCPVIEGGVIVYRDDDHLTATFSLSEAPILAQRILAAMSQAKRPLP
jgi:peptidoglycan/LPS O-acetylase OafA/YrhL